MSGEHSSAVFGPPWVQDTMAFLRERLSTAEDHIINLRTELCRLDPTLPDPYDGDGWWEWEQQVPKE